MTAVQATHGISGTPPEPTGGGHGGPGPRTLKWISRASVVMSSRQNNVRDDAASYEWRQNFIRTFVERDLPQLGVTIAAETVRRFWTMLAH
jgi:hypothetical protein